MDTKVSAQTGQSTLPQSTLRRTTNMSGSNDFGTILVTGATGFVGSHLVDRLLERGNRLSCLVRKSSNLRYVKDPGIELVYGGLDESTDWDEAFEGVDTVYHVAGTTFARRAEDYYRVNHKGTELLLSETVKRRDRIRRFVYISSLAATGPSRDGV